MKPSDAGFGTFFFRITACHMITYFAAGIAAFTIMDYRNRFLEENLACLMLPTDSPWVAIGPALQVFRGLVFAIVLYPFRRIFLEEPKGWLKLWGLFLGLAILSTAGPAPGSIEGMIYTKLPVLGQIALLWETVLQTLLLSVLLLAWYRRPHKAWSIAMAILCVLMVLMSLAGAFLPRPANFG